MTWPITQPNTVVFGCLDGKVNTFIHTYVHACMQAHTYMHTFACTKYLDIHACIFAYIHEIPMMFSEKYLVPVYPRCTRVRTFWMYVCMYVCIYVSYVCMYLCVVCMHLVCMYVCMYVYLYICVGACWQHENK
jgi:hypothetical protein